MKEAAELVTASPMVQLDAKITRSEFIDMIIADALSDLRKERDAARANRDAAQGKYDKEANKPIEVATRLLPASLKGEHRTRWSRDSKQYKQIEVVQFLVDLDPAHPIVLARKVLEEAKKIVCDVESRIEELQGNKSDVRAFVLRQSLEATKDGRALLAQIADFKVTLQKQIAGKK